MSGEFHGTEIAKSFTLSSTMCLPFVLDQFKKHKTRCVDRPFILGLNGVQGAGKTTLVTRLATALAEEHGLETLAVSVDDFYLTRHGQLELMKENPGNMLLQVRGQPGMNNGIIKQALLTDIEGRLGTHDIPLMRSFFQSICQNLPTKVPRYNKAAHGGAGDREPESTWGSVNGPEQPRLQIVILEGWCVGFEPLSESALYERYLQPSRALKHHRLEHVSFINAQLKHYSAITELFDALVHLDAERTEWVYDWRFEQEIELRQRAGSAMSDEQVKVFIDAYYPAYELYIDPLRQGVLKERGRQMRVVVGRDRRPVRVEFL